MIVLARLSCLVVALALCALSSAAENLLANPGFEDLSGDQPARWDRFLQPKPGAEAALADTPRGGKYAVRLHVPSPYEKEPVNNWSQNLIGEFAGATLRVSGFIRVEEAKEAAIWLQMWRRKPLGVVGAASTSTDMPVYGSVDWQEVSMEVPVPEGTDFVTVRCVLLGTGTAWFDDLVVERMDGPEAEDDVDVPNGELPAEEEPALEAIDAPAESVMPLFDDLEAEVRRLQEANSVLTEALRDIQSVNESLLEEMTSVREELQRIKEERGLEAPELDGADPETRGGDSAEPDTP